MQNQFRCELLSWSEIYRLARRLAFHVRESGFQPDVIVAIARGGYVPARLLCDFLDIANLTSIRIIHYTAGAHKESHVRLVAELCVEVRGARVLIVDDVSDTGDTLALALDHVSGFGPAETRIAVLHHKRGSSVEPDYFARRILKWRWITYPWALMEDLCGFIARMKDRPVTPRDAAQRLERDYSLKVSEKILRDVYILLR